MLNDLIKGCINCEPTAQRRLFELYAPMVMTTCRRYASGHAAAEDLLQEAFIKVFHHIGQYNPTRGSIEGWMKRIAINLAISQWRKENKMQLEQIDLQNLQFPDTLQADEHLHEEDLLALIEQLPNGYKVVFNLFAIEGYSHQEIAKELGITESTSRSQLSHARKFIKDLLFKQSNNSLAYEKP